MTKSDDQLLAMRDTSAWTFIYVGLVTDLIELQLIILTIVFLIKQYKR